MKSSKGNTQEEDEDFEEDFTAKKEATSGSKDAKSNDKTNAIRSKHSVTEQRRRSKINERFQILRDLIPHGDQKRDTASFLLEVIEYVQLLREKVEKYEGSYQGWSTEPTKLMPWRHSHWRVQNFLGHPLAMKNGPGPGATYSGKLDEKSISINPSAAANPETPLEPDTNQVAYRAVDQQSELVEKAAAMPMPFQVHMATPIRSDGVLAHPPRPSAVAQTTDCLTSDDQQEEHTIEGGTISISSAYSHELLTTLTQALRSSGVDLSQASISIRIDIGKRANQNLASGTPNAKVQRVRQQRKAPPIKTILSCNGRSLIYSSECPDIGNAKRLDRDAIALLSILQVVKIQGCCFY
ncbi:hypothetical protein Ancab_020939 [Ancistrocladus abbreviatus]